LDASFCASWTADADAASGLFADHHLVFGAVGVADAVLRNCAHLSGYPAGENLAALLFAETGAVEVAFDDESDDVDDELVLVQNGVDNDGDHRGEEVAAEDLDNNDDKAASLEHGAATYK
jgi:hypothetical protein